jgi:hypothetical protein
VPELKEEGLYTIHVYTKKKNRWWFGCSDQPDATAFLDVLPQAKFSVNYEILPVCKGTESREFQVGGFGRTNSSCDSWNSDVQTVQLRQITGDDSWTITGDRLQPIIPNDHCNAIGPSGRGYSISADGKAIQISVQCAPRSGRTCVFGVCSCSGGGTGYTFTLWVTAQKNTETPGNSSKGQLSPIEGFGSTPVSPPLAPLCEAPVRYTVRASGVYPDGTPQDFTPRSESANIPITIARDDGFTVEWNPGDRSIAATTPKNTCRGIY